MQPQHRFGNGLDVQVLPVKNWQKILFLWYKKPLGEDIARTRSAEQIYPLPLYLPCHVSCWQLLRAECPSIVPSFGVIIIPCFFCVVASQCPDEPDSPVVSVLQRPRYCRPPAWRAFADLQDVWQGIYTDGLLLRALPARGKAYVRRTSEKGSRRHRRQEDRGETHLPFGVRVCLPRHLPPH